MHFPHMAVALPVRVHIKIAKGCDSMASRKVLSASEAARAAVTFVTGSGRDRIWYGARPSSDGKIRMGYYQTSDGRSQRAFSVSNRRAVHHDGG